MLRLFSNHSGSLISATLVLKGGSDDPNVINRLALTAIADRDASSVLVTFPTILVFYIYISLSEQISQNSTVTALQSAWAKYANREICPRGSRQVLDFS